MAKGLFEGAAHIVVSIDLELTVSRKTQSMDAFISLRLFVLDTVRLCFSLQGSLGCGEMTASNCGHKCSLFPKLFLAAAWGISALQPRRSCRYVSSIGV